MTCPLASTLLKAPVTRFSRPWLATLACCATLSSAFGGDTLPEPPAGYRWVANDAFTDEFDGEELDDSKWHDTNPRWKGRPPGLFVPESVSLRDGHLRIKSAPLDEPIDDYAIACGAIQSKAATALYGYYECRMKASGLTTSSTFWLTSDRKPTRYGDISLELDIQECIGNAQRFEGFRTQMHSNTHIKLYPNPQGEKLIKRLAAADPKWKAQREERRTMSEDELAEAVAEHREKHRVLKKGATSPLGSPVDEEFHTYGCWWVDANTMHFYADGELVHTIEPRTEFDPKPFDYPMFMNLVCETYAWEVPPTDEDLRNDAINTTLYDYVRAYTLEPIR